MRERNSKQIGRDLRAWMASKNLTEQQLADQVSLSQHGVKVSQSWISRICSGDFERLGGKTGQVLQYAGIRLEEHVQTDEQGRKVLDAAIEDVWDGSMRSAQALASVLRSAGAVARAAR